jgi:periplasmic divalent cation tolerance protein
LASNDKAETISVPTGQSDSGLCLVYATFPAWDVADAIGSALVSSRLAACVNIIPGITSIYEWQGKLQRDAEVVMVIKTVTSRSAAVVASIAQSHPYDNPAIVVLPVDGGSAEFLRWIGAQTA